MRIATWNVNSVRARVARVVDWLVRTDTDVLAMQEIKCRPEQFPHEPFRAAGYQVVAHGLDQWNGVAFASRLPIEDVRIGFDGMPSFGKTGADARSEARALGAAIEGVELWSLYVPNGRALDDPHYAYKLEWLTALNASAQRWEAEHPGTPLALMGDWNVAPLPEDVGDPEFVVGRSTHVSPAERAAFRAFLDAGLADVVRPFVPTGYTFWDYKRLRFPRDEGLRIDFILGNAPFADRVLAARIDRAERKGDAPSDHVPVVVELADASDDAYAYDEFDDDRPMVF